MKSAFLSFLKHRYPTNESGQGLAEYLILLMLIAVVSISATKSLGGLIRRNLQQAKIEINRELTQHARNAPSDAMEH